MKNSKDGNNSNERKKNQYLKGIRLLQLKVVMIQRQLLHPKELKYNRLSERHTDHSSCHT